MKKFSILIDAVYICRGGGYILLIDLVKKLLKYQINFGIIIDSRISKDPFLKPYTVFSVHSGFLLREKVIHNLSMNYDVIISLNNIPTISPLKKPYFIYFHNVLYLLPTYNIFFKIKKFVFFILAKKSKSNWICQTKNSHNLLTDYFNKYNVKHNSFIFPFYPALESNSSLNPLYKIRKKSLNFVYVSDGHPYKNHLNLISAFCLLCDLGYDAYLSLTVSNIYPDIIDVINDSISKGYPIKNFLHIPNSEMKNFLIQHDVAVYPSSFESFGLGLIEAAQCELPIISSNRKFVYDVVKPFSVFNEESFFSIFLSLEFCFKNQLIQSELVISDQSLEFFNFLEGSCNVA